jgi:1-acyl-sn-glycerol-3-phosphate acyltransferase
VKRVPLRSIAYLGGCGAFLGTLAVFWLVEHRLREWGGGPDPIRARARFRRWNRIACRFLNIRVEVQGGAVSEPCVYLSNHRSYLDVFVTSHALGAAFLSRSDVSAWPFAGAVARAIGTVFVDRSRAESRARAARELLRHLQTSSVVVFPEGTTGDDFLPRPFAPGLFRLLRRAEVSVFPVTIRYSNRRAYWVREVPLLAHVVDLLSAQEPLRAEVQIGPRLEIADFEAAEALAQKAHAAVAAPILRDGEWFDGRLAVPPDPHRQATEGGTSPGSTPYALN